MTTMTGVPSFKQLDKEMQRGYRMFDEDNPAKGCRIWLEVWGNFLAIFDRCGIRSIDEFDKRFQGSELLRYWIWDMQMELIETGLKDPRFLTECIAFSEEVLKRFGHDLDSWRIEHSRITIAECHCRLGQEDKVDALYTEWLTNDPGWDCGWTCWSDCYLIGPDSSKNLEKAESILRKALSVLKLRNRHNVLERLADLLDTVKRDGEAAEVTQEMSRLQTNAGKDTRSLSPI